MKELEMRFISTIFQMEMYEITYVCMMFSITADYSKQI